MSNLCDHDFKHFTQHGLCLEIHANNDLLKINNNKIQNSDNWKQSVLFSRVKENVDFTRNSKNWALSDFCYCSSLKVVANLWNPCRLFPKNLL